MAIEIADIRQSREHLAVEFAPFEEEDAVRSKQARTFIRCGQHSETFLGERAQETQNPIAQNRIYAEGRLIQNEQPRFASEQASDADARYFIGLEAAYARVCATGAIHSLQRSPSSSLGGGRRHTARTLARYQLLKDRRAAIGQEVTAKVADRGAKKVFAEVAAVEANYSRIWHVDACGHAKERRPARLACAPDDDQFAGIES
jgi:hypothetical protein